LYVLNRETNSDKLDTAVERQKLSRCKDANAAVVAICGRLEAELSELDREEAAELLASYGLRSRVNRLISDVLNLMVD